MGCEQKKTTMIRRPRLDGEYKLESKRAKEGRPSVLRCGNSGRNPTTLRRLLHVSLSVLTKSRVHRQQEQDAQERPPDRRNHSKLIRKIRKVVQTASVWINSYKTWI